VDNRRIVTGLTVTFAAMSAVLVVVGLLTNPVALVLGIFFGGVAGLLYYQASGRLARRLYRSVEQRAAVDGGAERRRARGARAGRGGFGAGPREEWTGPHQRRGRGGRRRAAGPGSGQTAAGGPTAGRRDEGLSAREAYDVLGLDPGADADAIRTAYRDRVKDVHPDAEGGDEEAFRRVRDAYERLAD